jgi:hypothetical protein
MDNKLSELKAAAMSATPGPWFRSSMQFNGITTEAKFITQGNKPHVASTSEKRDAIFIAAANPATVLELLAELEAKDREIDAANARVDVMCAKAMNLTERAETAEKNMELHFKAIEAERGLYRLERGAYRYRIAELEAKLATPVRLKKVDSSNVPFAGDGFNVAVDYCAKAVRSAGFTVEGDE